MARRGKPSTWLPRQKLAAERKKERKKEKKVEKIENFVTDFFSNFFWSKTGFVEQIFLISGDLLQSWGFACPPFPPWRTWDFRKLRARASRNPARSEKPPKIYCKFRVPSWAVCPCGSITSRGRTSPLHVARRGKPSTWLPRKKLAEERKKEKETKEKAKKNRNFYDRIFQNFFGQKLVSSRP